LGLLPRGTWHIGFRTEIEQRILDGSGTRLPGLRSWSGEFAFDVEIVESFDDALPPVSDERWARMLRSGLRVEASAPDDGRHLAWIVLDLDRAHWPADLHLECEIELRCGGQPYGTSQFVAADVPEPHQNRVNGSALLERLPWRIAHGEEGAAGWSVVVRGVRGDALFDWNCERWWAGEVEVPLADLIRR
jgi:hypothetical protein